MPGPTLATIRLKRVLVEVGIAFERHTGQHAVVKRALQFIREAAVGKGQRHAGEDFHAHVLDHADFAGDDFARQAIGGNGLDQHPAGARLGFEHARAEAESSGLLRSPRRNLDSPNLIAPCPLSPSDTSGGKDA